MKQLFVLVNFMWFVWFRLKYRVKKIIVFEKPFGIKKKQKERLTILVKLLLGGA